jgi:hypothetical protein
MSTLSVDKIEPVGSTLTLGESGDTVTIPAGGTFVNSGTATGFTAGGLKGVVVYTGNGTYTPGATTNGTSGNQGHADVSSIVVDVLSAGGGSGSSTSAGSSGGAGSSGSYALKHLTLGTDRAVITTCTVTVGTAGPEASNSAGAVGGVSSFAKTTGSGSFTTVVTFGGLGGSNNTYGPAAPSAVPTTGDINVAGCRGYNVNMGGDSQYGWGGRGTSVGNGYGSGGACKAGTHSNGNKGTDGIVIIREYA